MDRRNWIGRRTGGTGQVDGQAGLDWQTGQTDRQDRHSGQAEQDRQKFNATTGLPGHGRQNRTARTGLAGKYCPDRAARTGLLG
jgi:hypothetical protein